MAERLEAVDCGAELQIQVSGSWETMHRAAFVAVNLDELLASPNLRGESVTVPDVAGRKFRARIVDETEASVPLVISGACDRDGVRAADHASQLADHLDWFTDSIETPSWTTLFPIRLLMPNGTIRTADAMFTFQWNNTVGDHALAVLRVLIPEGRPS